MGSAFLREMPMIPGSVARPIVGCQKRADGQQETAVMKYAEAAPRTEGSAHLEVQKKSQGVGSLRTFNGVILNSLVVVV